MNRTDYSRSRTRRVGTSAPPNLFHRRSKRRFTVPALIVLAVLIIVPAALGADEAPPETSASGQTGADVAQEAGPPTSGSAARLLEVPGRPAVEPATAAFATYEQLTLRLPADEVLLVGYHEASFSDALELEPIGDALANDNRTKFVPAEETADGPEYVVLSSRGRPQPATSAVDIVLEDGTPVLSPVTGTVTSVEPYLLYGEHEDTRIEIVPDDRPDLALVMIHIEGVQVSEGDRVEAGVTRVAGGPNRFPFGSQIDRFFDPDRWPHVHIEVKRG